MKKLGIEAVNSFSGNENISAADVCKQCDWDRDNCFTCDSKDSEDIDCWGCDGFFNDPHHCITKDKK